MSKIVHLEDAFVPVAGYQLNILAKFMAKKGHEVYIVTSLPDSKRYAKARSFFGDIDFKKEDDKYSSKYGVNIIRIPIKYSVFNRVIFGSEMYDVINSLSPDIVYVHGLETYTGIRMALHMRKMKCPVIFDSHMLEMASHNRFAGMYNSVFRAFVTPRLIKTGVQVIRTQNSDYISKCLGFPLERSPWISVGSDTMLFHPDEQMRKRMRDEYRLSNSEFVVIYTGKVDSYKGASLLAKTFSEKLTTSDGRAITLVVVGSFIGEEGKQAEFELKKSPNRVIFVQTQPYVELWKYYVMSDLSIFPKQCSLSIFDAQACGLPVVAEDNDIMKYRLSSDNGFVFKSCDISDFREKIAVIANADKQQYAKWQANALKYVRDNYDYDSIAEQYLAVLTEYIKNKQQ